MVKNEAKTLPRLLESVRGFADHVIALDTGSTDETLDILKSVRAEVISEPFVNFGVSRTKLMQFAKGKADWLLLLDADHFLRFDSEKFELDNAVDSYQLRHAGTNRYYVPRLVKGDINWRFVGSTHEYLESLAGVEVKKKLEGVEIEHYADGGSRADKFQRDLRLLMKEVATEPLNERARFYLANTQRDMGLRTEARRNYIKRVCMGGWDEEVFQARLEAAKISLDPVELWETWATRPTRAEPLAILEQVYRDRGEDVHAIDVSKIRALIPVPEDVLFLDLTAYGEQAGARVPLWRTIPGWCDFEGFYQKMAAMMPPLSKENPRGFCTFVEVGTYLGQSFACWDYYVRKVGKRDCFMIAVDTFRGTQSEPMEKKCASAFPDGFRREFEANMKRVGVEDPHIIAKPSVEAAKEIQPASVDFVFIDGEHSEAAVTADIAAWLPTILPTGYIGGHDYDRPEVAAGVAKFFARKDVFTEGRCWVARASSAQ